MSLDDFTASFAVDPDIGKVQLNSLQVLIEMPAKG